MSIYKSNIPASGRVSHRKKQNGKNISASGNHTDFENPSGIEVLKGDKNLASPWIKKSFPRVLLPSELDHLSQCKHRDLINDSFTTTILIPKELVEIMGRNSINVSIVFEHDEKLNDLKAKAFAS